MKILLINKYYYHKGGSETYLFNLQKLLESHGHQVVIFAMEDKRNLPVKNRRFLAAAVDFSGDWRAKLTWAGRQLWSWGAARPLEELIKKEKPDLVHCHNIYHQLGPNILKVCKKYHLPVVMTLHDLKLICPNYQLFTQGKVCERCKKHRYYQCVKHRCLKNSLAGSFLAMVEMYWHQVFFKTYLKNVDRFIVPSRFMLEKMVDWGWPREKFCYLPNFVSAGIQVSGSDDFNSKPCHSGNHALAGLSGICSNDEFNSPKDSRFHGNDRRDRKENYALYFGRLSYEKGVDLLIKAWSKVKGDWRLIIAGRGPQSEEYEKLIQRLKLNARVKLIGFQSGADLNNLIQKAALNIIPSRIYENCPLSLLEAGDLGTATLGAKIGGLPELIRPGINGDLFIAGNIKDLAEKINQILSQPENLIIWGQNARNLTQTYFNSEMHWAGLEEVYREVVANC